MLMEAGYPSSPDCGSSEAKQAAFVRQFFAAWDAHAAQITSVTWSWQSDISPASAATFGTYYGVSAKPFTEFLRTLGLRTYPGVGQNKAAWTALTEEAHSRGW